MSSSGCSSGGARPSRPLRSSSSVIRSVVGSYDDHSSYHTQTGWGQQEHKAVGGFPSIGSVVSKLKGGRGEAPAFVSTMGMGLIFHGVIEAFQAYGVIAKP